MRLGIAATVLMVLLSFLIVLGAPSLTANAARGTPFPLAAGNRWTLRDVDSGAPLEIAVKRRDKGLVLHGFPGAAALRVRAARGGVQAWDPADDRWEPFLRLAATPGARYLVELGATELWESVVVTVSRGTVRDFRGKVRRGCVLLRLRSRTPIADAGIDGLAFAPGIGPVRVAEQSFAGPRVRTLDSFRLRG